MMNTISERNFHKILVRIPNWIGDAVLSTPFLSELHHKFPQAAISIIGISRVLPIFLNNPNVHNILEWRAGGFFGFLKNIHPLKNHPFDIAFLLPNSFQSALIPFLSRIPLRIGYSNDLRRFLLTHPLKYPPQREIIHQAQIYLEMLLVLGRRTLPELKAELFLAEGEKENAVQFLKAKGLDIEKKIIGISPGAAYGPAKRWPPEKFAEVADRKLKEGAQVIVLGSREDQASCDEVSRRMTKPHLNLAGVTTLRELIAILDQCDELITNDNGSMHIGASLGIKTLSIFGSTDPAKTGPIGKNAIVIKKAVPCSPCFKKTCSFGHYKCLNQILPEDILKFNLFDIPQESNSSYV